MIDKLLNKFRSHPKYDGGILSLPTAHKFTERDLLERIKKCVNDTTIDKYNASYNRFARLLARDQLIIDLVDETLKELGKGH